MRVTMKKFILHVQRWNVWRKKSANTRVQKILVLFGIIKSPTMQITMLAEEADKYIETFERSVNAISDTIRCETIQEVEE